MLECICVYNLHKHTNIEERVSILQGGNKGFSTQYQIELWILLLFSSTWKRIRPFLSFNWELNAAKEVNHMIHDNILMLMPD